ncbi:MAG: hypothetical protein WBE34_11635 [Candidatus Nitrosopolaris sp.]
MGYFSRSAKTLIGPAVDDAANCYEKADWVGISLSPSTRSFLKQSVVRQTNSNCIVEYKIPQEPVNNYMTWAYWNRLVSKANLFAYDHCKYIKYKNTLDFYCACRQI